MKKTFLELIEIDNMVGAMYRQDPELANTKFGYAYKKFFTANYEPVKKEYLEALESVRIDHALEDEKTKAITVDPASPRGYAYSRDGLKAVIKAEKELSEKYEAKEVEVTPYLSSHIPEMTDEQKELLTGLVI